MQNLAFSTLNLVAVFTTASKNHTLREIEPSNSQNYTIVWYSSNS